MTDSGGGLAGRMNGLLFFPVTPFGPGGEVDLDVYRQHLKARLEAGPAAIFACCGTGEFFSLGLEEYAAAVRVAVEEAAGRLPVVAGVGYGTALAGVFADAAAGAGADGLLAMPPYLADGGQAGLLAHYRALADRSPLDVIIYQRDNAVFAGETVAELAAHPRIVGFKDGRGDLDLMRRIVGTVRARHGADALVYFNGLPTAEMTQLPYQAVGVPHYSSAVFCFAPDIAMAFYRAYRAGDDDTTGRLLDGFFRPYVELRHQRPGYAVALVKAGVRLEGLDVGPVRPPLAEPDPGHVARLAELIEIGRGLI
ncbi:MAG: 5-dehydro-4-deoxyglucarate dehydratase [Actinobacteria bacterium 13_2_20CM_2_72_6]|nr:MAG: 5-dehydro-4-deoxyglucarate dehydratase [Actinobacteria bacterium 13_2_20CM_2_72_6]